MIDWLNEIQWFIGVALISGICAYFSGDNEFWWVFGGYAIVRAFILATYWNR